MTNINFRAFADQIYGLIQKKMTEYITPIISREQFKEMFNNGKLIINDLKLKEDKNIELTSEFNFSFFSCDEFIALIPDEKSNFEFSIKNAKGIINLIDLKYENIEELLISNIKKFTEKYLEYAIGIIEKKDNSPSMIEGLIQNLLNKIIKGLKFNIENIELNLNYNNTFFIFSIGNILYDENEGIKIDNINLIMKDNLNQINIINDFGFELKINYSDDIENKENELNLIFKSFEMELDKRVLRKIKELIQVIQFNKYKELYYKMKYLIEYNKPKQKENEKKNYIELWKYAINTIIKLKYYSKGKLNIFDLNENEQKNIVNNFYNNTNIKDIITINKKNILLYSKEKIEKNVIDNKKKAIINPFAFFFGGKKDEGNKNELTQNEKEDLEKLNTIENIEKYLNNKIEEQKSSNPILSKILIFIKKLKVKIQFPNISLKLINENESLKLSLINIEVELNKNQNIITSKLNLKDIISLNNISFFNEKINDDNALIISLSENETIDIKFNFNNIQLDENIFFFILVYFLSSEIQKKYEKIFKENVFELNINKDDIFGYLKKINFPSIPSLSIFNENDRINISLSNLDIKEDFSLISFCYHINNNKGDILPNYKFEISKEKEKNNFQFHLNEPIKLILNSIFVSFIMNVYTKINQINENFKNNNNNNNNNENEIFNYFNFKFEKQFINIRELDYKNFGFDFLLKELILELNEPKCISSLKILNLSFKYNNLKCNLNSDLIHISTDKYSSLLLYILQYEPSEEVFKIKLTDDEFYEALNNHLDVEDLVLKEADKNYLFNELFTEFNILFSKIILSLNYDDYLLNIYLNEMKGIKNNRGINFEIFNTDLKIIDFKISKEEEIILLINKVISFDFDFYNEMISAKIEEPEFKLTIPLFFKIYHAFNYIVDNMNFDFILIKYHLSIFKIKVFFKSFIIDFEKITLRNFLKGSNDVSLLKIFNINLYNLNNVNIIKEKLINVNVLFKPGDDRIYNYIFNDLSIKITQIDLYKFILSLNTEYQKENNKQFLENNQLINFEEFNLDYQNNKKNKNNKFEYKIEVYNFKLFLCLENFIKISEISFNNFILNLILNINEDINNPNNIIEDLNYTIEIEKIGLIFFDGQNQEINVLTNIQKESLETQTQNTIIEKEKKDLYYQIKISGKNNIIEFDITSLKVIVRVDSFLSLYLYFENAIPIDILISKMKKSKKRPEIQLNIHNSKYILQTSFDGTENMILSIEEFYVYYRSIINLKLPYGEYCIQIKSIITEFISGINKRELFHTKNYFLIVKLQIKKDSINLNTEIQSLFINLSYFDIMSFLKAYQLNYFYYKNEKRIENNEFIQKKNNELLLKIQSQSSIELNNNEQEKKKISNNDLNTNIVFLSNKKKEKNSEIKISGGINFRELDIVLIDNSTGSYYPFLNLSLTEVMTQISNINTIDIKLSLSLNSFNYIACIWEPTIEITNIKLQYNNKDKCAFFIEDNELLINLSDMNISFVLGSLNNWIKKFIYEKKNYENYIFSPTNYRLIKKNESQISNNEVFNYSGEDLKIKYAGQIFNLNKQESIKLEYIKDWNDNLYGKKEITIIYNDIFNFNIPIEKLGTIKHSLNNEDYFISENTLSKDRHINISIYSPIIFRNKTKYDITIVFYGEKLYFYDLPKGKRFGIPFKLINNTIKFYFLNGINLNENKINNKVNHLFLLNEVRESKTNEKFKKQFLLDNKNLILNLNRNIPNVRDLIVMSEYSIVNCLPIEIEIIIDKKKYKIPKCTQFFLDFTNIRNFAFFILCNGNYFYSKSYYWFNNNDINYITFEDNKGNSFILSMINLFHSDGRQLIIYCDTIIKNNCSIKEINIYSEGISNKPFVYRLNEQLFLVSSNLDLKENEYNIKFKYSNFKSKDISMKDLLSTMDNYHLKMSYEDINGRNCILELNLNSNLSYISIENNIDFNENLMSMVISINPICKFLSMLSTKFFYIADFLDKKQYIKIYPMKKYNFNFFNRGRNCQLCFGISNIDQNLPSEWSNNFIIQNYGLYTFFLDDMFVNLEIRLDPIDNNIEIFISEANIENCKLQVENKSKLAIGIFEQNYDQHTQIIESNQKSMLKQFSQYKSIYYIIIKNNVYNIQINFSEEINKRYIINNEIEYNIISNGIKIHIIFYDYDINRKKMIEGIHSDLFLFNININSLGISIIGDNENQNRKLRHYLRKEILFIYMKNVNLLIDKTYENGIINRNLTKIIFYIENIKLYNQSQEDGKYSLVLYNKGKNNFCVLKTDLIEYITDKVTSITNLNIELDKIKLALDPNFIMSIIDFISNILYRMNLKNFNIDEIFSSSKEKIELNVIEEYKKRLTIYYSKNLSIPPLNISFELSSINIDKLLKNYLHYASFFSWVFKGLTGNKHNVNTKGNSIGKFVGNLNEFLMILINKFKNGIMNEVNKIAIKGFLFGIFKIFTGDDSNKKNNDLPKSIRPTRALYGKYLYFKNYNKNDADILIRLKLIFPYFKNGSYYFTKYIKGNKTIFVFTNFCLYVMDNKLNIFQNIDYFIIKDIEIQSPKVIKINFNQMFEKSLSSTINCENEWITEKVFSALKEQTKLYSDEILFIN